MTQKKILEKYLSVPVNPVIVPGVFKEREECHQLERMLAYRNIKTDYHFLLQTSGYASVFHYHPKKFWVYDMTVHPTIPSALNALGYDFQENRPETLDHAYEFIREQIEADKPVYMLWYEPVVVYGYDYSGDSRIVHWHNRPFGSKGSTWTEKEMETAWWNMEFFRSQMVVGESIEKPDMEQIFELCLFHTIQMAEKDPITKVPNCDDVNAGFQAYQKYIADLKNPDLVFQKSDAETDYGIARGWGCFAIYPQWTSRMATALFLKEYGNFAKPGMNDYIDRAISYFEQETVAWLQWEKFLGRNWELMKPESVQKHNEDYNSRWSSMENREKGADAVAVALELEKKAVHELKQYIDKTIESQETD